MNRIRFFLISLVVPISSYAGGCDEYPYTDGVAPTLIDGGVKIISTKTIAVPLDDIDAVMDAKEEATMGAKAGLAKFFKEDIQSDEQVTRMIEESKSLSGQGMENLRKETVERLKVLRNSTQAVLRGAIPLGDCYTKGQKVIVSVGIKPETINTAGNVASDIAKSINSSNTGKPAVGKPLDAPTTDSPVQNAPQGVDSYSNTKQFEKF
jgi:hypothetical protein